MAELNPSDYTVAWIAPLEIEARAAICMLDHVHTGRFPVSRGDEHVFTAGDACGYNVVVATLPAGQEYGTGSAACLAGQIKGFFRNLHFGLLVGIAAGLPKLSSTPARDIRLGDVLISLRNSEQPGIIGYSLGKDTIQGGFQPLHHGHIVATTDPLIRSAISKILTRAPRESELFLPYYEAMKDEEHRHGTFIDPGQEKDLFYDVDDSGMEHLVTRQRRPSSRRTRVWYGTLGSGEVLIKNHRTRNNLRDKYDLIGLEMEAAGTMNRIPVGVIRGVSDYGDGKKTKEWQPYAAAMAAAYAKAILTELPPNRMMHAESGTRSNTAYRSQEHISNQSGDIQSQSSTSHGGEMTPTRNVQSRLSGPNLNSERKKRSQITPTHQREQPWNYHPQATCGQMELNKPTGVKGSTNASDHIHDHEQGEVPQNSYANMDMGASAEKYLKGTNSEGPDDASSIYELETQRNGRNTADSSSQHRSQHQMPVPITAAVPSYHHRPQGHLGAPLSNGPIMGTSNFTPFLGAIFESLESTADPSQHQPQHQTSAPSFNARITSAELDLGGLYLIISCQHPWSSHHWSIYIHNGESCGMVLHLRNRAEDPTWYIECGTRVDLEKVKNIVTTVKIGTAKPRAMHSAIQTAIGTAEAGSMDDPNRFGRLTSRTWALQAIYELNQQGYIDIYPYSSADLILSEVDEKLSASSLRGEGRRPRRGAMSIDG